MITGKSAERYPMARESVAAFEAQTYPAELLRLLIINTGRESMMPVKSRHAVREVFLADTAAELTLGDLRNKALDILADTAPDDWVIQWDDDDYHGVGRVERQMYRAAEFDFERPVTLWRQIRYSFGLNAALTYYGDRQHGVFGTVAHPPTSLRYESARRHEDSRFLKLFPSTALCTAPAETYIRFEHGHNTWHRGHIMGRKAQADVWEVTDAAKRLLTHVLQLPGYRHLVAARSTPCET